MPELLLGPEDRDYCSAPVTANHTSSEPDMTKTIGATHCRGSATVVLMSESPDAVAGKGTVLTLTVETAPWPSSLRQLTSARNVGSSFGEPSAKMTPRTLKTR